MKLKIIISIIFTLLFPLLGRAEEIPLTLDEAITLALRDNRDVLLKAEELNKAKLKIAEAEASLFPSFNLSGGWTDTRGLYSKDLGVAAAVVGIKQILYKGGKVINAIEVSKDNYTATQAILDKTKLELVLSVKKAFYTLLFAEEFASINKGILDNTQEHLDFIHLRYENGQASESDVLWIKSSLSSVKRVYDASLNQQESSQEILKNLLYLDKEIKIKAKGKFDYEPKEIIYDEAFLNAMQSRPEIRQFEAQHKAAEKGIEIAKADSRPNVYASWDYYSCSHATTATAKNWNDYNVLGITVSWPIFDGWLTKAKVEQAIIDLKEAQLAKEKIVRDITLELKTAYLDLKNAITKIKSVQEQVNVYKDNLSVIEEKYKAGIASLSDLHDASLSYQVALFNQTQAIYDYIVAKASFDKAGSFAK